MIVTKKWQWSCGWECCFQPPPAHPGWQDEQPAHLDSIIVSLVFCISDLTNITTNIIIGPPKQCISDLTTRPTPPPCLHFGSSHNEASRILNVYCGFLPPRTLQVLCFGLNLVLYVVEEVSRKYILQRRRRSLKKHANINISLPLFYFFNYNLFKH